MYDATNLAWPETPFGAGQRPFGRPSHMLTAVAVDWAPERPGPRLPVAAAVTYMRIRRIGLTTISPVTLNFGFRAIALNALDDLEGQLAVIDRCLLGARRHATVLAGHRLGNDLAALQAATQRPLRGVSGLQEAWAGRETKGRGVAHLVDTAIDVGSNDVSITVELCPPEDVCGTALQRQLDAPTAAEAVLHRCVAIALTAARRRNAYTWIGRFDVEAAVETAGWDVLTLVTPDQHRDSKH